MGWTGLPEGLPAGMTRDEFLRGEITWPGSDRKVLASATVGGAWYAALDCPSRASPGKRYVTAIVALVESREGFSFKIMDEGMGPVATSCPAKILGLLTPLPCPDIGRYAEAWRGRCRLAAASKAGSKKRKQAR